MRRAARPLVVALCVTVSVAAVPARAAEPGLPSRRDAPADVELAGTPVPSAARRVGEVRLIRRGDAAVVQTRLETAILARAVGEIGKKERANWPTGTPGHDAAARYVAALERAVASLPRRPVGPRADRRRRLLIEFVLDAERALVAVGAFASVGHGAGARPAWRTAPAVLDLDRAYVRRNMELIVADAFGDAAPARARLAALLAAVVPPSGRATGTPAAPVPTGKD